jgi:hypothetical protein
MKSDVMVNAGERGLRSPRCRQFQGLQRGSITAGEKKCNETAQYQRGSNRAEFIAR